MYPCPKVIFFIENFSRTAEPGAVFTRMALFKKSFVTCHTQIDFRVQFPCLMIEVKQFIVICFYSVDIGILHIQDRIELYRQLAGLSVPGYHL